MGSPGRAVLGGSASTTSTRITLAGPVFSKAFGSQSAGGACSFRPFRFPGQRGSPTERLKELPEFNIDGIYVAKLRLPGQRKAREQEGGFDADLGGRAAREHHDDLERRGHVDDFAGAAAPLARKAEGFNTIATCVEIR